MSEYNSNRYVGNCARAEVAFRKRMDTLFAVHDGDNGNRSLLVYDLHNFEIDIAEELVK